MGMRKLINHMPMKLSALIIGAAGTVLITYFYCFLGHRGKALVYTILLVLFTGFCIWGIINWDEFTGLLKERFGVLGMSGIVLLIALAVWLAIQFLF